MMRRVLTAATLATMLTITACGTSQSGSDGPPTELQIMVASAPGGGYDQTARAAAQTLEAIDAVRSVHIDNIVGSNGVIALQKLLNQEGDGDVGLQMGLGVLGAASTAGSGISFADTVALARMIEESSAIVVPRNSGFGTLDALLGAWRADPRGVTVGGGSKPGGPDHLLAMQLAESAGIDPRQVNYIPFDGGGELLPAVLGSKVSFAISGISEVSEYVKVGDLKALSVSGEEPAAELPGVPTLREAGIDVVFANWRGIVAPPGISDEDRQNWIDVLDEMHDSPQWHEQLKTHGWRDAYLTGPDFQRFLDDETASIVKIMDELGLS